jgi:hypothetical protein
MAYRKTSKRCKAKTILRLADLEQSKNAVLQSLCAASSQESYGHAIDEFIGWYCSEHVWHLTELSSFAIGSFSNTRTGGALRPPPSMCVSPP